MRFLRKRLGVILYLNQINAPLMKKTGKERAQARSNEIRLNF